MAKKAVGGFSRKTVLAFVIASVLVATLSSAGISWTVASIVFDVRLQDRGMDDAGSTANATVDDATPRQSAPGTPGGVGKPGADGADGAQGPQGVDGEPGVAGPPGPQGRPGAEGIQGLQGPPGPQGDDGTSAVRSTTAWQGWRRSQPSVPVQNNPPNITQWRFSAPDMVFETSAGDVTFNANGYMEMFSAGWYRIRVNADMPYMDNYYLDNDVRICLQNMRDWERGTIVCGQDVTAKFYNYSTVPETGALLEAVVFAPPSGNTQKGYYRLFFQSNQPNPDGLDLKSINFIQVDRLTE